jgi:hypothetical protein
MIGSKVAASLFATVCMYVTAGLVDVSAIPKTHVYKFKVMKGVRSDALPSYLDERMWRDRWGTTTKDAFYNLCRHISEKYPF